MIGWLHHLYIRMNPEDCQINQMWDIAKNIILFVILVVLCTFICVIFQEQGWAFADIQTILVMKKIPWKLNHAALPSEVRCALIRACAVNMLNTVIIIYMHRILRKFHCGVWWPIVQNCLMQYYSLHWSYVTQLNLRQWQMVRQPLATWDKCFTIMQ